MKTINVGRGNYGRIFFVLAALGALYFYRRQGGSLRELYQRGVGMIGPVRDFIAENVPSTTSSTAPSATI